MTMHLEVTPAQLRATADHLSDVSNRMWGVLNSLQGSRGAVGGAWGDDSIGDQFAGGGNGYIKQSDWVDGSIEAKTTLLNHYAHALRTAADTLEQQDQQP
jgi:uncharacterized protein YukE